MDVVSCGRCFRASQCAGRKINERVKRTSSGIYLATEIPYIEKGFDSGLRLIKIRARQSSKKT
jgi:hypothetical protein